MRSSYEAEYLVDDMMIVTFADLQDEDNPGSGVSIDSPMSIRQLLEKRISLRHPVVCQLSHADGSNLVVGVSPTLGFAQYTASDAMPPYLMAVNESGPERRQAMDFAVGDTRTPIDGKFLIPMEVVIQVAEDYVVAGQRSDAVSWIDFE